MLEPSRHKLWNRINEDGSYVGVISLNAGPLFDRVLGRVIFALAEKVMI